MNCPTETVTNFSKWAHLSPAGRAGLGLFFGAYNSAVLDSPGRHHQANPRLFSPGAGRPGRKAAAENNLWASASASWSVRADMRWAGGRNRAFFQHRLAIIQRAAEQRMPPVGPTARRGACCQDALCFCAAASHRKDANIARGFRLVGEKKKSQMAFSESLGSGAAAGISTDKLLSAARWPTRHPPPKRANAAAACHHILPAKRALACIPQPIIALECE